MPAKKARKNVKRKAPKARKPAKKASKPAATAAPKAKPIGEVTHFFDKIRVAVVKLHAPLKVGDKIRIEGHGQKFTQSVGSMQMEHEPLKTAKKGQEVGMKVSKPVKAKDQLFKA